MMEYKNIKDEVKKAMAKENLLEGLKRDIGTIQNEDLAKAVIAISLSEKGEDAFAWKWLIGEKLLKTEQDKLGMSQQMINSLMDAADVFTSIIKSLLKIDYSMVFVMVDEFEDLTYASDPDEYQRFLRMIIDQNTRGFSLFISESGEAFKVIDYRALGERLSPYRVRIPEIKTHEDIKEFIIDMLSYYRKNEEEKRTTSPFTKEVIEALVGKVGTARTLKRYCYKAIELGLKENKSKIDSNIMNQVIKLSTQSS